MEVWAKDAGDAVAAALTQLSDTPYKRMELFDEHGIIFFRQAPSRLAKPVVTTPRYFPTAGARNAAQAETSSRERC